MRRYHAPWNRHLVGVAGLLAAVMIVAGCASSLQQAKEEALSPAIELAWPGVRADAFSGSETAADSSAVLVMNVAVEADSCAAADLAWPAVETLAVRGLNAQQAAGTLGTLGKETKIDRLNLMGEALDRCAGDPTDPEGEN